MAVGVLVTIKVGLNPCLPLRRKMKGGTGGVGGGDRGEGMWGSVEEDRMYSCELVYAYF